MPSCKMVNQIELLILHKMSKQTIQVGVFVLWQRCCHTLTQPLRVNTSRFFFFFQSVDTSNSVGSYFLPTAAPAFNTSACQRTFSRSKTLSCISFSAPSSSASRSLDCSSSVCRPLTNGSVYWGGTTADIRQADQKSVSGGR